MPDDIGFQETIEMSKYLANLFLAKEPCNLWELEAELKKTLKGHMSGSWKKPCFHTPYGWTFDDISIVGEMFPTLFFQGSFAWGEGDKKEKMGVPIGDFIEHEKVFSYMKSSVVSDDFLEELVEEGEVFFPDGSFLSQGKFAFGRQAEIEKCLTSKFSKDLLRHTVLAGGKEASRSLIKNSDGALLLCEFSEAPQW